MQTKVSEEWKLAHADSDLNAPALQAPLPACLPLVCVYGLPRGPQSRGTVGLIVCE